MASARAAPERAPVTAPAAVAATVTADWHAPAVSRDMAGAWDYAAVDPATGTVFVARMAGVLAIATARPAAAIMLAPGRHVHAVVPLPGGRLLFTNGDDNTATVVRAKNGAFVGSVPTGLKPDGAIDDPARREVLVMDGEDGSVTRIGIGGDLPHIIGRIALGGKLEAPALGTDDRLFVNVEDRNALDIVSLSGPGRLVKQVKLDGCEAPSGLAFDPSSQLLVSACENGVAQVLDQQGRVRAALPIGTHPDAVVGDPERHRVYVPSGSGTLSEISLNGTPRVTRVWRTRSGARTGALDARRHEVYLPYGEVVRTLGRPASLVPGSFGVLVVDVR